MIKFLIGGTPCTSWSCSCTRGRETTPAGIGWEHFRNFVVAKEKWRPDFILYENNKSVAKPIKEAISKELGLPLQHINSALVSAQNRERFYAHNFGDVPLPKDRGILLEDILESGIPFRGEKSGCLDANYYRGGNLSSFEKQSGKRLMVAEPVRVGRVNKGGQGERIYSISGKSVCLPKSQLKILKNKKEVSQMKLTYQQWENLTPEQQNLTPEDRLPEIPQTELQNGLLMSRMIIKDSKRVWEIQVLSENGQKTTKTYTEYKQKDVSGTPIWYKFNPMWGYYSMNLTGLEPSTEEAPLGNYGTKWLEWMKEQNPHLVAEMQMKHILLTVARSVDERAWAYRELLEKQYMEAHPYPNNYEENVKWHTTRNFYVDGAVMREKVLIPYTAA